MRTFLLDAPLELRGHQVLDVDLEAWVPGGGRIDVEAGCAAIEVKKNLDSASAFQDARAQLAKYVKLRTEERKQRYVGILTDGRTWVLFHLTPHGDLAEVDRLVLRGGEDAARLASWLETVLATTEKVLPTADQIERQLGAESAGVQVDLADLRALYDTCRWDPEVKLKRELWARLLLSALGTNFQESDELFVTHTYLVLTAELVAHEVLNIPIVAEDGDIRSLLEGQQFELAGLHGVVEADFFDWPATTAFGSSIIRAIARRLARFAWGDVQHDVLKVLYESIIDARARKRLGEYYTPDWLAEKMVDEQLVDPLAQRVLDPACGSGTFLFWAVRRSIEACESAGYSNRATIDHVVSHVAGMDLHPVAVTLARVTYLLAITPERLRRTDRGPLTVPVYLGDSVRWEHADTVLTNDGITVHTSDELELVEQDLHFPESVVEEPARFDRLVAALARKVASRKTLAVPKIGGLLNAHQVEDPQDRAAVELVFAKLCRLHDAGRDHLWGYYIRNLARPLSFTRPDYQADLLLGNPPWLGFRHMTAQLQETYQKLAERRGLWVGGRNAPNQDLSDLFVARSVEQYLRPDGAFAFVMPHAVLSRFVFEGFRSGRWWNDAQTFGTSVQFGPPEDFAKVKPAMFPMPACVVQGTKSTSARSLNTSGSRWTGRLTGHDVRWKAARDRLAYESAETELATSGEASPYRTKFRRGATLFPRVLVKVTETAAGPLGMPQGVTPVASSRASVEKEPWKSLKPLKGAIEQQFLWRTQLGASIVSFRAREPELAVVPWLDEELLHSGHERLDEFPGLAAWWNEAERLWNKNKAASNALSLRERIDFQRGVTSQFPTAPHRVVYTNSGQYLAACRLDDPTALVEQTLLWAPVTSAAEAQYLCAIFNSDALAQAVLPLQARGQHNPRHFAMALFAIPFGAFDSRNPLHTELAGLAARAEDLVAAADLSAHRQFQAARRAVREILREEGLAADIDEAVSELLVPALEGATVPEVDRTAPDLLGVLADSVSGTAKRPKRRAHSLPGKLSPTRPGVRSKSQS